MNRNGLIFEIFDRCVPLLVNLQASATNSNNNPFIMESMWYGHPYFKRFVTKIFDNTNTFDKVIRLFKDEAITWNKSTFSNIFRSMKRILTTLIVIQNSSTYHNRPFVQDLDKGDANIEFFHTSTLNGMRRNKITSLKEQASWV